MLATRRLAILAVLGLGFVEQGHLVRADATARGSVFFDVRGYGAVADGKTKNTRAIHQAIAAAAAVGGGTIYFGSGQYLTGPIHVKSNITLFVDAGAVVKFSTDFDDYLPMVRSRWEGTEVMNFSPLIYGDKVENVAIQGRGILDGQGEAWWAYFRTLRDERKKTGTWKTDSKWQREFQRANPKLELPDEPDRLKSAFLRPPFIQLMDCKNLSIEDVTIRNSPFWNINPVYCDNVTVRGITIYSPDTAPNTDGIDPESCRNVHISDSHISVGDDCITIKSGRDAEARRINRPAENYTITNCTMLRGHGGVVIGSEMSGGVDQIAISNCVFDGTDRGIRIKSTRGRGGTVQNVRVSNIVMRNIREEAITLNMFYTNAPAEAFSERTPRFRNIHISGVSGSAQQAGLLLGLPESRLENVSIEDVDLVAKRGFVIKDAKDIQLRSVIVETESGPAFAAERVENLFLSDTGTRSPHPGTPVVDLGSVKNGFVRGCFATVGTELFVQVRGSDSQGILIDGNHFQNAKTAVGIAKEVGKGRVVVGSGAATTASASPAAGNVGAPTVRPVSVTP
jgi:polygalacturonase